MHDATQIPSDGWIDETDVVHPPGGSGHCCSGCGREYAGQGSLGQHQLKCEKWLKDAEEGVDYVKCALCDFVSRNIKSHVQKVHNLSREKYQAQFGSTICQTSQKRYSETENYNWIERVKKEDPEKFEDWRSSLGEKISEGVMKTPSARRARRENMTRWNKSAVGRAVSSVTAQKTSSRTDIQEQRAETLQKWRDNNPDAFYEKCISKMVGTWQSKPEGVLFDFVASVYPESNFKRNQQIRRINKFKTVKSGTRQIDILSQDLNIVIEFDGIRHFRPIQGQEMLDYIQLKDHELNTVLVDEGFIVIRVAYDQFDHKQGGNFSANCIARVVQSIERNESGLYLIGDAYEVSHTT